MVDDCRPRSHYCGAVDRAGQRGERGYAKKKVAAAKTKADAAKGVAVLGPVTPMGLALAATAATGAERVMRSVRSAHASQNAQPVGVETKGTPVTRVGKPPTLMTRWDGSPKLRPGGAY